LIALRLAPCLHLNSEEIGAKWRPRARPENTVRGSHASDWFSEHCKFPETVLWRCKFRRL